MEDEPFMKIERRKLFSGVLQHIYVQLIFARGKKRIWMFCNNNKTITTKYQSDIPNITMHMHAQMYMDGNPIGSLCGDMSVKKNNIKIFA